MKNFNEIQRKVLVAAYVSLFSLLSASGAAAQQTAEQLYRQFVASSGYGSRMVYESERSPVLDMETGQPWNGLHIDTAEGRAPGTPYRGATVVVRNVSGLDYCIRPAYALESRSHWDAFSAAEQRTYLLEAGSTHLIFTGSILRTSGDTRWNIGIGYWRPDLTRDRICSDVAPSGLESWASAFNYGSGRDFGGSRR